MLGHEKTIRQGAVARWSIRVARRILEWPLRRKLLVLVAVLTVGLATARALDRAFFTPGHASDAHHLIEGACGRCHVSVGALDNRGCLGCHERTADETHPVAMFDDPRWTAQREVVDATRCASCHGEHDGRAVTAVAPGLCYGCHDDVTSKRRSHRAFAATSCAAGGCHNYHDNDALAAAYLERHLDEPDVLPVARVAPRPRPERAAATDGGGGDGGGGRAPVVPAGLAANAEIVARWQGGAHAPRVGCRDCHVTAAGTLAVSPADGVCAGCHEDAGRGFAHGKHGVRAAVGLRPLAPAASRLPMRKNAPGALGCGSCHDVHSVDTGTAAVAACLGCHDDRHSRSFPGSPHDRIAAGGAADEAAAVTCATCHQPRREGKGADGAARVVVEHDNSRMSRPRDRMVRAVCVNCHGVGFAMAAIHDQTLVANNFRGRPAGPHASLSLVAAPAMTPERRPRP